MNKSIYDLLDRKKSANINKTNNYNNTNDTNNKLTTTTLCLVSNEEEVVTSSSLGKRIKEVESLDSKSEGRGVLKLPPEWRGVKLDLFNNGVNKDGSASLKLNIGVIRADNGESVALQANLNSSWDSGVRRGVDAQSWREDSQWIVVKKHRKELEYIYTPRYSKIGLKRKQGGTEMVAFVYEDRTGVWCVDIVRNGIVYEFELTDPVNEKQQQGNMIATAYRGIKKRALIKPEELGI